MTGSALGFGTPMTQPSLPFPTWGAQLYGQPLSFTPYGLQQPHPIQQLVQLLQTVPAQLHQLQQLQYVEQQQLQQIQQVLQIVPAQLANILQLVQSVPNQGHQQIQPFQQTFGQPAGGGLGIGAPWGFATQGVSGQAGHLM